jgi:hypothetical protein
LAQVRTLAEAVPPIALDLEKGQEVTRDELCRGEVYIVCSLSALAPRMRFLQELLAGSQAIHLGLEPAGLLQRFEEATRQQAFTGTSLRVWNRPRDADSPVRLLRRFLPPVEGGSDRSQREHHAQEGLVSWEQFPDVIRDLPDDVRKEAADRLDTLYARPFLATALHPRMPRDLALRGQLDEAILKLVEMRDQLRRQRALVHGEPDLTNQVQAWCAEVQATHQALMQASARAQRTAGADAQAVRAAAQARLEDLLRNSQKASLFVQAAAIEPLDEQFAYQLALCHHEKAERAQARRDRQRGPQAAALFGISPLAGFPAAVPWGAYYQSNQDERATWKAVSDRWQAYVEEHPRAPSIPAAQRLLERARRAGHGQ